MKKVLSLLLLFISVFVIFGCEKDEKSLDVQIIEKVYVGEYSNYTVKLLPDDIYINDYNYRSSNENILKVEKSTVMGLSKGTCELIISYEDKDVNLEKRIEVLVNEKSIKEYEVEPIIIPTLSIGDEYTPFVKIKDTDVVINSYSIISLNEEVATFERGKVLALKEGKALFKGSLTYEGVLCNFEFEITVEAVASEVLVNELKISGNNAMNVGESQDLVLEVLPSDAANKDVAWSSSDEAVLKVVNGKVEAVSAGTAIITCQSLDGSRVKADFEITVSAPQVVVTPINEVIAGATGEYTVEATVVAISGAGFLLSDNNGFLFAYKGNSWEVDLKSGDKVRIAGEVTEYGKAKQFGNAAIVEKIGEETVTLPEAEVFDGAKVESFMAQEKLTPKYIEITGTLSVSGNYLNLAVEGTEKVGSLLKLNGIDANEYNGKTIIVKGFALYTSSKDKYLNIMVTNIEEVGKDNQIYTNIPSVLSINQYVNVTVKNIETDEQINDYEIIVSNEDCLYFDESSKVLEAFDIGESTVTVIAYVDGKEERLELNIKINEGYNLNIMTSDNIIEGESVDFVVTMIPGDIVITDYEVSISDNKVIKYENKKLFALSKGVTRVFVSYVYDGITISGFVDVVVNKRIDKSLASNINEYMFINEELSVVPLLKPYNDYVDVFTVKSSNDKVIEVTGNKINAKSLGSSKITISCEYEGKEYIKEVDVTVYNFEGIILECPDSLFVNEVHSYVVKESSNNIIIHNHNIEANNNILVCNDHVVYAKTPGVTSLKVSYNYNGTIFEITKDINIIDIVHNAERLFVEGSKGILVGTSETLKVSSYPKVSDLKVKYYSSDETIATVDANGKITALKEGNCLITISLLDDSTVYTTHKVTLIKQKELSEVGGSTSSGEYLGRYYEESIKYYYELMHDVKETTYIGYTSTKTSGIDVDGYTGLSGMIEPDKFYPQMVHVLEVPSSKSLKVVPWANLIGNKWTLTTVKGFINNYEESHPGSKVICAINGDFFDISANGNLPYQTTGENVSGGEFYRTSNGHGGGGTLGFTNNGTADSLIADGKAERTKNMILAVYDENNNIINEFEVENLNKEPIEGQSSVYFGNYNSNKEYEPISFDVISGSNVYMIDEAELALPNNPSDFYGLGTISSLEAKTINKGQFAIVSRNKLINETLKVGVRIRIQYEFTGRFKDVTGATGYNNLIYNDVNQLHDGYIADRAPRTVLGKKADGTLVMMVIDGRQGGDGMYGADGTELAAIMKSYGCVNAYNLDGGGSSTIVVRDETGLKVLNSPSDNRERTDGNCILIVAEDPNYTVTTSEITSSSATITINTDNPSYITDISCLEINGKIYDSVNNKVTLDNLVHNTKYDYKVYYKDSKGNYYETLTVGSFTTAKANFKYLGVTLEETDDSYTFKSYCNDVDSAGNVMSMEIEFNGLITYFSNGKIVLSKSIFGDYIENVKFRYNYEDNGKIIFVDTNEYAVLN